MSAVYDNWERLVGATLRREQFRLRALRSFSALSLASSSAFNSRASSRRLSSFNVSEGEAFDNEQIPRDPNYFKIFTFAELKSATGNFSYHDRVLDGGDFRWGGFGRVFMGWIDEKTYAPSRRGVGIAVNVKWSYPESEQHLKTWQAKIEFLGKLSHPNIVKLLGYCLEDNRFLLVYEYIVQKGSLETHLFRKGAETLSWEIRMKIATGAARALAFLHTTEGQVIHRDINAANIWLDGDYNAKLLIFSLAKFGGNSYDIDAADSLLDMDYNAVDGNYNFTKLGGNWSVTTDGYAASEYITTGDLYVSSDVYSFGVMLLEIVSGRRVLDRNRPTGEQNLVDWAMPFIRDRRRFRTIVDPRLQGQHPSEAVLQIPELIFKCLVPYPKIRPSMKQVLETLEKISTLKRKSNYFKSNRKRVEQLANHGHLEFQLPPLYPIAELDHPARRDIDYR